MTVDVNRRISAARLSPVKRQKIIRSLSPGPGFFICPETPASWKSVTLIKQAQNYMEREPPGLRKLGRCQFTEVAWLTLPIKTPRLPKLRICVSELS